MISRYTHPDMGRIWSDQRRYETWLLVETAAAEAMAAIGIVPPDAARDIRERGAFDIARIEEIEQVTQHDVIAFTTAVAEKVGPSARWLHFGLTSSDVIDTAQALQMREACDVLLADLDGLANAIRERALEHRRTPMIGRTHGVHAEPMTFGLKLALWYAEVGRDIERIRRARAVVSNLFNSASCCSCTRTPPAPTMSLSASPASVAAGKDVSLTANCTSPDSVPVSVASWTSTGGSVSGSGNSATLSTAGAAPGSITVSATCTDSRGLTGQASTQVAVENPPPPPVNPEVVRLESRLSLHSVYFVTAYPLPSNPKGGLLPSQQKTLISLAADFKKYLESKPDAHLILGGHADHRGSAAYNQALSERRVARTKSFLVEQGVPEANIDTKAFGSEQNLTDDDVKGELGTNTELTSEEKARVLKNIVTIRMASNRRVDVTLSTTGQSSVRQFPFNAEDALTLIGGRTPAKKAAPAGKTTKKPAPKK